MELLKGLATLGLLEIWVGGLCQLFGMPVAWLRLRRSGAWAERAPDLSRLSLLAAYMRPVTELAILWSLLWGIGLVLAAAAFGWEQDDGALVIAALLFVFGIPLAATPWAVARLDPSRAGVVDRYRVRREGAG